MYNNTPNHFFGTHSGLSRFSITFLGVLALANAQISIRTNSDGTSSVSLAGEMSVSEGMTSVFPDISNTAFSCAILAPVKAFYERVKGKATLAAMVSESGAISLDKEEGMPIEAILGTADGRRVLVPAFLTLKVDVNPGSVLRVGGYEVKALRSMKAGERILVSYIVQAGDAHGVALLSAASEGGNPVISAFSSDSKNRDQTIAAWRRIGR